MVASGGGDLDAREREIIARHLDTSAEAAKRELRKASFMRSFRSVRHHRDKLIRERNGAEGK